MARIERGADVAQDAGDGTGAARALCLRHGPPERQARRRPRDAHALVCGDDQQPAIGLAADAGANPPCIKAVCEQRLHGILKLAAHSVAPAMIAGEILRLRYRPPPSRARNWPFSTATLPRRTVTTGQAKMSWPSQGV